MSSRVTGMVTGLLAGAVAAGVAQLAAGLTVSQASPVIAVGQAAIGLTPETVRNSVISAFGTNDKTVLLAGIGVVLAVFAAVIGMVALGRGLRWGYAGLAIVAAIGLTAALTRPTASPSYAVPTLIGIAAGACTLRWLVHAALPRAAAELAPTADERIVFGSAGSGGSGKSGGSDGDSGSGEDGRPERAGRVPVRREFLTGAGVAVVAAAATGLAGRELSTRHNVSAARTAIRLPRAARPIAAPPPGADLRIRGLSPFITPNNQFYRVDTALILPQVDPSSWQLRIHGMVRREVVLTFDQLLHTPLIEDYITLCCVSDPVGGPYISNAKWLGARLASLLRSAGPLAGADQLLCTSVDGFTSGTPLSVVLDGRDALVAVAMNGSALPVAHGFPARLVVPGLYGYVSACKWVTDINVTTFSAATAYWVQQGWAAQGPIKTESRIDVPALGASLNPGMVTVAGVAWAQHKGVDAVEVRVDRGPWQPATLAAVPGIDTWRQWSHEWNATSGSHVIEARATDATGYTQTGVQAPVEPNGATGYPTTSVIVR